MPEPPLLSAIDLESARPGRADGGGEFAGWAGALNPKP